MCARSHWGYHVTVLAGLFVVGTDTGVGKTYVASAITRCLRRDGLRVGVLKPVATDVDAVAADGGEDGRRLIAAAGGSIAVEKVVPIAFSEPLAPVVAARRQGVRLSHAHVEREVAVALAWWSGRAEILVV